MINLCKSCKYFSQCGDYSRVEPCDGYAVEIPTPEEVEQEIKAARADVDAYRAKEEAARAAFRTAREKAGRRTEEVEQALNALSICENERRTAEKVRDAIQGNYIVSVYTNALPVIIEEFKKYAGKPYGEKTRRKISDAINERAGVHVYIDSRFGISDNLNAYSSKISGTRGDISIYTEYDAETKSRPAFLIGNKINAAAFDALALPEEMRPESYIVAPLTYNDHLDVLRAEIEAKRAELETAIHNFNDFCSDGRERLSTYINIK